MKFLITIDVPEARKDEIVPKEMQNMFEELANYYKEQRNKETPMKNTGLFIRDGEPNLSVRVQSINVQGEV
ncbi:hypothetical protein [Bacillus subtilis]|uniref:Uncharacterized protein n=1 Tax=Bacillus subtilis TaxID=1423 RepID=A0A8I2B6S3_BACIU|nr:hypothetical protein [Bacillus subtilis]KAF2421724.1 hypothetical protein B6K89_21280 [Bacillus subtilis]MBO3794309.1 hypothetical protein [Bacillus subtilis]MED3627857.1 hypothetical protein [Bacillus subtilis]